MKDYYKVLRVEKNATQEDIKKSFRKLAKKFHPDANPGNLKAEEVFKEINEAYAVLSVEDKKIAYDRQMFGGETNTAPNDNLNKGHSANTAYRPRTNMSSADFAGASNAFEDFFGFDPNSSSPQLKKKNNKVKPMKTNEAFEAIFGKKRF